jgi:putative spermidine/putrescine transport system permease protein
MTRNNSKRTTLLTTLPVLLFVLLTSVLPICFLLSNAFSESGTPLDQGVGWSLENFREIFYDSYYVGRMLYTVALVVLVSVLTLMVAMPLTIVIARLKNFWRSTWVVLLLASLALSEVLTAYAWQIILSKSSGLPGWLERLGLLTDANSWWPGFPAMLLVLIYFSIPIAMVMLLPPLSRMDGSLSDTARMMGFSKIEVFWRVTLPVLRRPIFQTGLLLFLLNSGGFVISQQLGRPSDWMFSVFIADFMRSFNVPFAVALALCLLLTVVVLVGGTYLAFGREGANSRDV